MNRKKKILKRKKRKKRKKKLWLKMMNLTGLNLKKLPSLCPTWLTNLLKKSSAIFVPMPNCVTVLRKMLS